MKRLIGEFNHWGIKTKAYYNGDGEQITIENSKIGTIGIASRPRNIEGAIIVVKATWGNDNLIFA